LNKDQVEPLASMTNSSQNHIAFVLSTLKI